MLQKMQDIYWDIERFGEKISSIVLMTEKDPRVEGYFLMEGPLLNILILILYIYIVKFLGPKLMQNREPFKLTSILFYYNLVQVLLSFLLLVMALDASQGISIRCAPCDRSTSPAAMKMLNLFYVFYLCKIGELLDTIFFVLRKKFSQVSFLNLFHHTIMPFGHWFVTKYYACGSSVHWITVNASVHVLMYSYYLLAAMGPRFQKYLWWKKYLTIVQIIQVLGGALLFAGFLIAKCPYGVVYEILCMLNFFTQFCLFMNFYIKNYVKKTPKRSD